MRLTRIVAFASLCGATIGAFAVYVGAKHNTQGEFNTPSGVLDPIALLPIFFSWFILTFAGVLSVGIVLRALTRRTQEPPHRAPD